MRIALPPSVVAPGAAIIGAPRGGGKSAAVSLPPGCCTIR